MVFIRKRKKADGKYRYLVAFVDPCTGRRREISAGTSKAAAKLLKQKIEREILLGTFEASKPDSPLFLEYYKQWIAAKEMALTPDTLISYQHTFLNHILPYLGEVRLDDIKPRDIQAWISCLSKTVSPSTKKKLSPSTIKRAYRYYCSCQHHAFNTGVTQNNPCRGIILPRQHHQEMDFLKPDEIRVLLDAAPEPEQTLFAVLAYSGLRLGEALSLRWKDIDFGMGAIRVERAYTYHGGISNPKTKSSRRAVTLLPILAEILEAKCGKPDDFLYSKSRNPTARKPVDPANARKVFERSLEAAGLKHVTMHSLRHTFATVLLASGASIKALQRALGHASASMTLNTYSHFIEESMTEPARRASALFQGIQSGKVVSIGER